MIRRHFLTTLAAGLILRPFQGFSALATKPELRFLVVGDWGTGGSLQKAVATGMKTVALATKPMFVLSTGDNIYPRGVSSAMDKQWTTKFENVYKGLDLPWWAILGNHDYRGDVEAQVAYGQRNPKWHMPDRTWSTEFKLDDVTKMSLTALDTTPLMQKSDGWKKQLEWLEKTLALSTAQHHIVAGHHPLRSYGHYGDQPFLVNNVKPILDAHKVMLYCCGHDHDLQTIKHPDDTFGCLVSGGGGGSRPTAKGANTRALHTGGGFASVTVSAQNCAVVLYDSEGAPRGEMML